MNALAVEAAMKHAMSYGGMLPHKVVEFWTDYFEDLLLESYEEGKAKGREEGVSVNG